MAIRFPWVLGLIVFVASCSCPCWRSDSSEARLDGAGSDVAAAPAELTHTVASEAEYCTTGPQQARPPEGTLAAGTRVKLVESAGSYSRIVTEDGITAYVASDALSPIGQ